MTDPIITTGCYEIFATAIVLATLLLCAVFALCWHIKAAVLGSRLLKACAGDWQTACLAVENVRMENELLTDVVREKK